MNTHPENPTRLRRRVVFRGAMMVLMALAIGGCAAVKSEPPELQVRQLASQRWQALLSGNFDKAYTFSTPSYRQIHTSETFKARRQATPVQWLNAEVIRVECQDASCVVRVKLQSKPLIPSQYKGLLDTGLDETWVKEDGLWWMLESL